METPENGESDDVTTPSDEENNNTEGDDISDEPSDDEEPVEEEPSEEEVVDPSTEDEETISNSTLEVETFDTEAPAAPEITVTRGTNDVTVDENGKAEIPREKDGKTKFAVTNTTVEGVKYYYTTDGKDPKNNTAAIEVPEAGAEIPDHAISEEGLKTGGYTFLVVAVKTDGDSTAYSEVTRIEINYKKAVFLAADSSTDATVKAENTSLSKDSGYVATTDQNLELTVTASDEKKEIAKVEYKGIANTVPAWSTASLNAATGNYVIPKNQLSKNILVKVTVTDKRKITVTPATDTTYDMFTVTVKEGTKVVENNKVLSSATDGNVVYASSLAAVTVTIQGTDGCTLKNAKLDDKAATNAKSNKVDLSIAKNVANKEHTIVVTAEETYNKATVREEDKNGEVLKTYDNVNPRKQYYISATQGNPEKPFSIGEIKWTTEGVTFTQNPKTTPADENGNDGDDTPAEYDGTWTMEINDLKKASGKTVTAKLYANKGDAKEVDTLTFKIAPVVHTVTVTGNKTLDGKKVIEQEIGTTKSYALTVTDGKSADGLKTAISDGGAAYISEAKVEKDEKTNKWTLSVTTKATKVPENNKVATISILHTVDKDSEDNDKELATVDVYVINPAWTKTAATVKQTNSTDVAVDLDLTLPSSAAVTPKEGVYLYKVVAEAGTGVTGAAADLEKYYPADKDNKTTKKTMKVLAADFGSGKKAAFNVTATLILAVVDTNGECTAEDGKKYTAIATGATSKAVKCETKDVYHSEKLTLKKEKAASGLYTGQEAVVATVGFDKLATYNRDQDVEVAVLDANGKELDEDTAKLLAVVQDGDNDIKGGKITLRAEIGLPTGKYKIRVTQKELAAATESLSRSVPNGTITATATMDITVVQGIEKIEAANATIYVKPNDAKGKGGKDGKAKIVPVYNANKTKPKTAKVIYELVKGDEYKDVLEYVTLKPTGEVIVSKKYKEVVEDEEVTNNKFAVKITPNDFKGKTTAAGAISKVVEFTITTAPQELGQIVLVKEGDGNTFTKLEAPETGKYTADSLNGALVRVLDPSATATQDGEPTALTADSFVPTNLYTLKTNKKNAIDVAADGKLTVKAIADGITLDATTTDGGNLKTAANKGQLKFSITYAAVEDVVLQIKQGTGNYVAFTKGDDGKLTAALADGTPTGASFSVIAGTMENSTFTPLTGKLVDYKVKVDANATIVNNNGDKNNLKIDLVMKKVSTTLTLTNQKGQNAVTYTINNKSFTELKAAPTVKLKAKEKIYANYTDTQKVVFTVDRWKKATNGEMTDVAKIKITAAADPDSQKLYSLIPDASKEIGFTPSEDEVKEITVNFANTKDVIKKATLYFDFVKADGITPVTQTSMAVTVKTELLQKSFKLTDKYTMSAKDQAKVGLKYTAKGVKDVSNVEYKRILNANIKGRVNQFVGAFDFDESTGTLILANEKKADKKYKADENTKEIDNTIGFVEYTVTYDDGFKQDFTTKLTITMKGNARTLKATASNVLLDKTTANMTPVITVMDGKNPVNVAWASYDNGTFEVDTDAAARANWKDGKIALKVKAGATPAAGTLKADLKVIPAENMYDDVWDTYEESLNSNATEKVAAPSWAAIEETATTIKNVSVVTKAAKGTKGKIAVDSKLKNVTIKDTDAKKDTENKDIYEVTVPYTVKIVAKVQEVKVAEKNDQCLAPNWISFKKADGDGIVITINKNDYVTAVLDSAKDRNGNFTLNGKKQTKVTAQVVFAAEASEPENIEFTITPPTLEGDDLLDQRIKSVEITTPGQNAKLAPEGTLECKAEAKGETNVELTDDQKKVTWSMVTDGVKEGTKITAGGTLTIDKEETVTSITIKATSVANSQVSATAEIAIETTTSGGGGN